MEGELNLENNQEIQDALKQFETDSRFSPVPQKPAENTQEEIPRMVRWVIKISGGAIKEQRQAEYVLLGFIAVAVGISLYLFFGAGSGNSSLPDDVFIHTPRPTIP